MTCHFSKNSTAAEIMPLIPSGKQLVEVKLELEAKMKSSIGNLKSFVLLNRVKNEEAIQSYTEVRDMDYRDHEQFGDSEFKEKQ